jgi:hypothetical protein
MVMGFWEYFYKWLSMSFAYPWSVLQTILAVAAIAGGVIAHTKPQWVQRMKNISWAWKVPLIIFAVVFVGTFVKSSYDLYQDLGSNIASINNEVDILTSKVILLEKAQAVTYSGQMPTQINKGKIVFPVPNTVVSNKIFNDCSLFLEQNWLYFRNCTIVNGSAKGTTAFAIIFTNTIPEGTAILFVDCVLEDCWFVDANIIGDETEIAYCKSNIK